MTLDGRMKGLDSCPANRVPYINQCGYDQAGVLLQHIYGELNPPTLGPLTGTLKNFDQSLYTGNDIPGALSLADRALSLCLRIARRGRPAACMSPCMAARRMLERSARLFVEHAGYNRWADANRIIVLYPQTKASPFRRSTRRPAGIGGVMSPAA